MDGDSGPKTEAAVKAYQQDRDVEMDGIVGDQTWWFRRAPRENSCVAVGTYDGVIFESWEMNLAT